MRALFEQRRSKGKNSLRTISPKPIPAREKVVIVSLIDGICDFAGLDELVKSYLDHDPGKIATYQEMGNSLVEQSREILNPSELIKISHKFVDVVLTCLKDVTEVVVLNKSQEKVTTCCTCGEDISERDTSCPSCGNEVGILPFEVYSSAHAGNDNDNFLAALNRYLGDIKSDDIEQIEKFVLPVLAAAKAKTKEEILNLIKKNRLTRQSKNITYIYHRALGYPYPNLTISNIDLLMGAYYQAREAYDKIRQQKQTSRTSSLNSTYMLTNLMRRLGISFDPLDFKEIKTVSTIDEHEILWRQICEILHWN